MATIRAYTTIKQSRKLTEILPLESADMSYVNDGTAIKIDANSYTVRYSMWKDCVVEIIPCWSLAALLSVLPEIDDTSPILEKVKAEDGYDGYYYHIEYKDKILIPYSKNPIDACVAMVEKLHELNLL